MCFFTADRSSLTLLVAQYPVRNSAKHAERVDDAIQIKAIQI